jgi:peroxiredoxin
MKRFCIVFISLFILFSVATAQENSVAQSDTLSIKQTALDYAEGYYSGDVFRMERAILPELNKANPASVGTGERVALNHTTYSQLIEVTRAKSGELEESKRKIKIFVLSINDDIANVKINSAIFNDYLQMVRIDGQWKIINVLWTWGEDSPNRIQGFHAEEEKTGINDAVTGYIEGILRGDARRIQMVISSEYSKVTFRKLNQTGKTIFNRQGSESIIENTFAEIGRMDDFKQDFKIDILDIMDGLAIVALTAPYTYEYIQLYKSGGQWLIFNTIEKQNQNLTWDSQLPVFVGEQMPDFTLPIYGGGDFSLSEYKGKNIMLVFPRGWIGNLWCPVCHYQYLEISEMEKQLNLKKKYNLEIAFILPYDNEKVADWFAKVPQSMQIIDRWKNPQGQNITPLRRQIADFVNVHYPKKFDVKAEDVPRIIPVLVDADRKLSKRLYLFTHYWDEVSAEQNIPTVFIIDKTGKVQFKYQSQITFDRPTFDYLIDFIKKIKSGIRDF